MNIFPHTLMLLFNGRKRKYGLYEYHNTTDTFVRAMFTSDCKKHFVAQLKLFKKCLDTFWNL